MALNEYRQKRDFDRTPEPAGKSFGDRTGGAGRRFVIQKHAARRLHYDFRLEWQGVLKSWAVPKGPPLDPARKTLAVHVEDHPLEYADFEGVIPAGQYGGGTVMLWDEGTWEPVDDPQRAYRRGSWSFRLRGKRLAGQWRLVRMRDGDDRSDNWLLVKSADSAARPGMHLADLPSADRSVRSGRTMEQIASDADRVWRGGQQPADLTGQTPGPEPLEPGSLPHARRRTQPPRLSPQLATLVAQPPRGDDWLHELKFDGYRLLAAKKQGTVKLWTRRGQDWTDRFPTVAQSIVDLPCEQALLDGEVVVLASDGTSDFQALQNSLSDPSAARQHHYYVFDLPHCGGFDLTGCRLLDRKRLLEALVRRAGSDVLRYSDHVQGQGPDFLANACRYKLEGMISKRAASGYQERRTRDWVKVKCLHRQEFVVGGYTDPSGGRSEFGSLLLGYHRGDSELVYCGRVGTGFTRRSLQQIGQELRRREMDEPPFDTLPRGVSFRDAHWCRPELVAEVEFSQWTADGLLRHASFQGLRFDKPARQVVLETPAETRKPSREQTAGVNDARRTTTAHGGSEVAGVRLSNPDRLLYAGMEVTKRELAEYYARIAPWILPHLEDRPVSVVRCPRGRENHCFFQKHIQEGLPDAVRGVTIQEKGKQDLYLVIDDLVGLISLVQLGTLEFHPWGARTDRLERPDRIVMDLDPGEGVAWPEIVAAANLLRKRLASLDLDSYARISGGKGVHVVVPLERRSTWEEVKTFARDLAEWCERTAPRRFVATASKARRRGKIFVDYLRNGRGATAIASYSTRARSGAPVAVPLRWDELTDDLAADAYDVRSLPRRLASLKEDPWKGFFHHRQVLTKARRKAVRQ